MRAVSMYTPDLDRAAALYRGLGLEPVWSSAEERNDGTHCARLGLCFPQGGTELILHDDPNRQFTELELVVEDVHEVYRQLSREPAYLWLELPHPGANGCRALLRTPDGNLFTLVSVTCACRPAAACEPTG